MHSKDKLFRRVNWLNSKTERTMSSETEEKAMQLLSYSFFFFFLTSYFHQRIWLFPAFEGVELLPQNISFSYFNKPGNILHELSPT